MRSSPFRTPPASSAGTATVYAIASVPIAATPGGAPIGTLSPTSEVKVLETEGDQLKVRISG